MHLFTFSYHVHILHTGRTTSYSIAVATLWYTVRVSVYLSVSAPLPGVRRFPVNRNVRVNSNGRWLVTFRMLISKCYGKHPTWDVQRNACISLETQASQIKSCLWNEMPTQPFFTTFFEMQAFLLSDATIFSEANTLGWDAKQFLKSERERYEHLSDAKQFFWDAGVFNEKVANFLGMQAVWLRWSTIFCD